MSERKGNRMLCNIREWLNRKTGHYCAGNIVATVERCGEHGDDSPSYDMTFRIADCSVAAALSFNVYDDEDRRDGKHKIAVLRKALDRFEPAYLEACAEMEAQAWKKGAKK